MWTPEVAYAVGLITTDGCLSSDGRHFDFTSNDKNLIETFKGCLGLTNRIVPKRSGYTKKLSSFRIQFGNVTLHRWLMKLGLMPNKSKRLGSLIIPDEFFFHFLRGHLDGDGTIRKFQDLVYPKSTRLSVTFMSASAPHLLWLRETMKRLLGISGSMRPIARAYRLTFSKHDSIKLLKQLYPNENVPHLVRKFVIAREFLPARPR